jgi:hypothetical protein
MALGGDYQQEVDLLGAGVAKALLGKAALPDDPRYGSVMGRRRIPVAQ